MRKDVAEKWVAALRSGKYEQGTAALCTLIPYMELEETAEQFCCLGVLCEVVRDDPDFLAEYPEYNTEIVEGGAVNYRAYGANHRDTAHEYLPSSVVAWVQMKSNDGAIAIDGDCGLLLSHMNDTGTPFSEIAELIEAHVEEL